MPLLATKQDHQAAHIVAVMLNGGRVTAGFREALFDAAARDGVSVNEFVLQAAAGHLLATGYAFPGVFAAGDLDHSNDNTHTRKRTA